MLTMKVVYTVDLTPQEFRLISAALRGVLKDEWKKEAVDLQQRLFKERNKVAESQLANITKLSGDGL